MDLLKSIWDQSMVYVMGNNIYTGVILVDYVKLTLHILTFSFNLCQENHAVCR